MGHTLARKRKTPASTVDCLRSSTASTCSDDSTVSRLRSKGSKFLRRLSKRTLSSNKIDRDECRCFASTPRPAPVTSTLCQCSNLYHSPPAKKVHHAKTHLAQWSFIGEDETRCGSDETVKQITIPTSSTDLPKSAINPLDGSTDKYISLQSVENPRADLDQLVSESRRTNSSPALITSRRSCSMTRGQAMVIRRYRKPLITTQVSSTAPVSTKHQQHVDEKVRSVLALHPPSRHAELHNPEKHVRPTALKIEIPWEHINQDTASPSSYYKHTSLSPLEQQQCHLSTEPTSFASDLAYVRNDQSLWRQCGGAPSHKNPENGGGLAKIDEAATTLATSAGPSIELPESLSSSIALIENVAATKVFFETYYNGSQFGEVTPRSLRRRRMEMELYHHFSTLGSHLIDSLTLGEQQEAIRLRFFSQESEHLRELRLLRSRRRVKRYFQGLSTARPAKYEVVRALGKGSFGVVNLVRERTVGTTTVSAPVYAMKVIKKSEMLRNCQEAHLRAERDFLVSCADNLSRWVVPLIASFQDLDYLYLVMEFAIGGDFLTFLIHQTHNGILEEELTRWYMAEIVLCVEEAHKMRWIHRDVKPDNFLITHTGHLKIADFGLAFDGHWAHNQSYYSSHRYSLIDKFGLRVDGDADDKKSEQKKQELHPTIRSVAPSSGRGKPSPSRPEPVTEEPRLEKRKLARSIVGTSQYMAPEVVRGDWYDGRCDWWSVGIIAFECLYGYTPFCREDRDKTKMAIAQHAQEFCFPPSEQLISPRAKDLIYKLLQEMQVRLCSQKYFANDFKFDNRGLTIMSTMADKESHDYAGRHVYSNDAADIKRHRFFDGIPWEHIHMMRPPWIPEMDKRDLAKNFDPEDQVLAESSHDDQRERSALNPTQMYGPTRRLDDGNGQLLADVMDGMDGQQHLHHARPIRRKVRKRPRDKLLRDPDVSKVVMETRKKGAFLGYTYRRPKPWSLGDGLRLVFTGQT